jgi:hypothetical protein
MCSVRCRHMVQQRRGPRRADRSADGCRLADCGGTPRPWPR